MKEFIKKMLSSNEDASSKRFNGTIAYILAVIVVLIISLFDFFKDWQLSVVSDILIKTVIWSAIALLGVTSVEKLWTIK